jgi:hypothetical protein
MPAVYPEGVYDDPKCWQRARRLDALALALVEDGAPPAGAEEAAIFVCDKLASYRQGRSAPIALPLFEAALALAERHYPPDHAEIAVQLSNLGNLSGDPAGRKIRRPRGGISPVRSPSTRMRWGRSIPASPSASTISRTFSTTTAGGRICEGRATIFGAPKRSCGRRSATNIR